MMNYAHTLERTLLLLVQTNFLIRFSNTRTFVRMLNFKFKNWITLRKKKKKRKNYKNCRSKKLSERVVHLVILRSVMSE